MTLGSIAQNSLGGTSATTVCTRLLRRWPPADSSHDAHSHPESLPARRRGGSGPGDREAHPCAALKAARAESPHQNRGSSHIVCEIDGAGFTAAQVAALAGKSDPGTLRNFTPILTLPTHVIPYALAPDSGGSQPPRRLPACPTLRQRFHFHVAPPRRPRRKGARHKSGCRRDSSAKRLESECMRTQGRALLWGSLVSCGRLSIGPTQKVPRALAPDSGGSRPPRRLPACPA
jgi:hypothetical protein